jgi:DUF917 family protein
MPFVIEELKQLFHKHVGAVLETQEVTIAAEIHAAISEVIEGVNAAITTSATRQALYNPIPNVKTDLKGYALPEQPVDNLFFRIEQLRNSVLISQYPAARYSASLTPSNVERKSLFTKSAQFAIKAKIGDCAEFSCVTAYLLEKKN